MKFYGSQWGSWAVEAAGCSSTKDKRASKHAVRMVNKARAIKEYADKCGPQWLQPHVSAPVVCEKKTK